MDDNRTDSLIVEEIREHVNGLSLLLRECREIGEDRLAQYYIDRIQEEKRRAPWAF